MENQDTKKTYTYEGVTLELEDTANLDMNPLGCDGCYFEFLFTCPRHDAAHELPKCEKDGKYYIYQRV